MTVSKMTPAMIAELKAASPIYDALAQELADKWGIPLHSVRAAAVITEGVEYRRSPTPSEESPGRKSRSKKAEGATQMPKNSSGEIKDYTILSAKGQAALAKEVKEYITMGWSPFGGVSAAAFGISPVGGNQYIQAMVKYFR